MWKPEHRTAANCRSLRYPSAGRPLDPAGETRWPQADGRCPRGVNAIFYVLSTGCQWQALPKDLPPKSTAYNYFML